MIIFCQTVRGFIVNAIINDPAPRGGVLIDKECFAVTPQAAGYKSQGFAINPNDKSWIQVISA
jgi:hypothetical protein